MNFERVCAFQLAAADPCRRDFLASESEIEHESESSGEKIDVERNEMPSYKETYDASVSAFNADESL